MTTLDKVSQVFYESAGVSDVNEDTPLDSLNIDSLEFIDLILNVNAICGVNIPDELVSGMRTVGDICNAVETP